MNLMSSIAKTFVGSDIAIVSVAPVLFTGSTPYLRATSPGTTFITVGSISKCARWIDGTPNCCESVSLRLQSGVDLLGRDDLRLQKEIAQFYDHWRAIEGRAFGPTCQKLFKRHRAGSSRSVVSFDR